MYREHELIVGTSKQYDTVYPCVYREHLYSFACAFNNWRFIPVCTGNTWYIHFRPLMRAVYPCVYREHGVKLDTCYMFGGLSLCVQGTHVTATHTRHGIRFIPVCTGNTDREFGYPENLAVYPCVYREHDGVGVSFIPDAGLSLCVQGTLS